MSSTYLSRTPASAVAAERRKFTFSCWYKRCELGGENLLLSGNITGSSYTYLRIGTDNTLRFRLYDGGDQADIQSNKLFRDTAAWYHIVLQFDSTQSTSTDRVKIYVNNTQITSLQANTYPSQDYSSWINHNSEQRINTHNNVSCYFAEIHQTGGQIYAPTTFGETDSTTGEWKPKSVSGVSYGTNGFYLKFENAGAMGTDSSGNSNTFTVNNAGTNPQTTDTPSNNFCTLSGSDIQSVLLDKGNLDFDSQGGSDEGVRGTMGVLAGKWYYECKITGSAGLSAGNVGYAQPTFSLKNNPRGGQGMFVNGSSSTNLYNFSSSATVLDAGAGFGQNDIMGVALNLTDNQITFYKNGTQVGSTQTIASGLTSSGDFFIPVVTDDGGVNDVVGSFNFGNPTFTIASGNADANGHGNFEYAVPSGYYALCTKNLNTYG